MIDLTTGGLIHASGLEPPAILQICSGVAGICRESSTTWSASASALRIAGGDADTTGLAGPLGPERLIRVGALGLGQHERRHLRGGGHQVVQQGRCGRPAVTLILGALVQGLAETLRDGADGLALDHHGVHDHPVVVDGDQLTHRDGTGRRVDLDHCAVAAEREGLRGP